MCKGVSGYKCVYVCMCVCVCVCRCVWANLHGWVDGRMYACIRVCKKSRDTEHMYVHICVSVYISEKG